jgi:hypothetical protein
MIKNFLLSVTGIALLVCAVPGFADEKPKSKYRTMTGCLSKPEGGDEYFLIAENGNTWEIHSRKSTVSLSNHIGQTVRVKGVVEHAKLHNLKEDTKDETGIKRHETEHGHLKVTSIHQVGPSCRR